MPLSIFLLLYVFYIQGFSQPQLQITNIRGPLKKFWRPGPTPNQFIRNFRGRIHHIFLEENLPSWFQCLVQVENPYLRRCRLVFSLLSQIRKGLQHLQFSNPRLSELKELLMQFNTCISQRGQAGAGCWGAGCWRFKGSKGDVGPASKVSHMPISSSKVG